MSKLGERQINYNKSSLYASNRPLHVLFETGRMIYKAKPSGAKLMLRHGPHSFSKRGPSGKTNTNR